ncbi:MAG: hypothetical protein ACRDAW_02790, partial [Metamycoplasmataceae bacterium]
DLNPFEMLWHYLKQAILAWNLSDTAELKQLCKEEWAKTQQRHKRPIAKCQMFDCSGCCQGFRGKLLFTH